MRQLMVRYMDKPERVEEKEELVGAGLRRASVGPSPAGLRYATFNLDDGASFNTSR